VFSEPFLTSLGDTLRWCVGVNRTSGDLGVFDCTDPPPSVMTDWFFDTATTRLHVSGHPFMCATMFAGQGRQGCSETSGGRLEWTPCAPCTIGIERVVIGSANTSGLGATVFAEYDTASAFYPALRTTQLLMVNEGVLYAVFGTDEEPTGIDLSLYPQGLGFIVVAAADVSLWYGYVLDETRRCGTVTATRANDGSVGSTTYSLDWIGCVPVLMFPGGGGPVPPCTANTGIAFVAGVFQYVCTRGHGGPIKSVLETSRDGACSLSPGGDVQSKDGGGFGAAVVNFGNGTFGISFAGIGWVVSPCLLSF
jgi:hypothetical protein